MPIAVQRHLRKPLGAVSVVAVRRGVLAHQTLRANHPEETIGDGHAFQVGLVANCAGQVQRIDKQSGFSDVRVLKRLLFQNQMETYIPTCTNLHRA